MNIPQHVRAWIYRVATAAMPLAITWGIVNDKDAALWLGVISAVLVPGLAAVNTPRK
jgi:hypothetical protein